jgi:hypothetical protein
VVVRFCAFEPGVVVVGDVVVGPVVPGAAVVLVVTAVDWVVVGCGALFDDDEQPPATSRATATARHADVVRVMPPSLRPRPT